MRLGFLCRRSMSAVSMLIALSLLGSGCAQRRFAHDGRAPSTPYPAVYRTEVGIGSCLFAKDAEDIAANAALPAALVAGAISAGVDAIGAALAEAAKETRDEAAAFRNVEVDSAHFGPCLQVVRGWFVEFASAAQRDAARAAGDERAWAGPIGAAERKELWQRRMRIAGRPDFVFEAQLLATAFDPAKAEVYLTLAPRFAWLGDPASQRLLRVSKDRDVAVFFGFHEAGEKFGAVEGAGAGIALGRLERGVERRWAPFEADTTETPNRGPSESQWFRLKLGKAKTPLRISALVVEHQDASAYLGFVAGVFGGAKKELKAAAGAALVPAQREAARESELAAGEGARDAYETALAAVRAEAIACVASQDAVASATKARSSIRAFNAAARASGHEPVDEALVPLSGDLARVRAGCRALAAAIARQVP